VRSHYVGAPYYSDDLPAVVNAKNFGTRCAGRVDLREHTAAVEEAVDARSEKVPHDLPGTVDAQSARVGSAGHIYWREHPATIDETGPPGPENPTICPALLMS
jgi:hypothetical protein